MVNLALRLFLTIICLSISPRFTQAELVAVDWLNNMALALRKNSYQGTYIYMRGPQFETMQVSHHYQGGHEYERIVSLTGVQREIIRQDAQTVYLPIKEHPRYPGIRGPFSQRFNKILVAHQDYYDFALHGYGRIAGRTAMRVSIKPKNRNRHGYRLWLDEETGLLLRSDLVNRGRVLELLQFTDIKTGDLSNVKWLATQVPAKLAVYAGTQTESKSVSDAPLNDKDKIVKPAFRVAYIPRGFRQVSTASTEGMVLSDGVATLSIFVETNVNQSLGNIQTTLGGTVLLSRQIKNSSRQITVVGELPINEAKKVAESVEPMIY